MCIARPQAVRSLPFLIFMEGLGIRPAMLEIAERLAIHGGRLATDAPESPHLLAPKIKSRVYIAGAIEDQSFPDETK
jgi:hypothetical protein